MDKIFENRLIFEEGRERSANSPVGFLQRVADASWNGFSGAK